jgi:peptidoglycan/LPS O-acetylase OafA/YrhL
MLLGAACAYAPRIKTGWSWLGAGMIGLHLVLAALHKEGLTLGWTLAEAGTALLIVAAPTGLIARALSLKPVVGLGLISYGVYLWHFPIACYFELAGWKASLPAMLIGGVALGAVSYFTVERLRHWRPIPRQPVRLGEAAA